MTRKCFKSKNSYLFTQKSMANFSIFLITTLLVTILIGQPSTAIIPNSNQSATIISQNSNQVNSNSSNSSADSCVESLEKEEKKTQRRRRNSESESETEKDKYGATHRKDTTRGGKLKPTIISPGRKAKSNKPTISWCAVEGATSYNISIKKSRSKKELWNIKYPKEDQHQFKYPNLLHLPYPSDKPRLETKVFYVVTIKAHEKKKQIGSRSKRVFRFISK